MGEYIQRNTSRLPNVTQSEHCTIRTLHNSNTAQFEHCTIRTLHNSNTAQFERCTIRTLPNSNAAHSSAVKYNNNNNKYRLPEIVKL